MGAGLLCTAVAVAVYARGRGRVRKWAGGLSVTAALLLHATIGA